MKALVYIIAIDRPESPTHRNLAKLLVCSLLKTHFSGEIILFRNTAQPIFLVERARVEEVLIEDLTLQEDPVVFAAEAWSWKYRVRRFIDADQYDSIMFLDCDMLALANIDHLFVGDCDIRYQPEIGRKIQDQVFSGHLSNLEIETLEMDGVNSGTFIIKGTHFNQVLEEWEALGARNPLQHDLCHDQATWNRLLLDTKLRAEPFPPFEVTFPLHLDPAFKDYRRSTLVHAVGGDEQGKSEFLFGLYMGTFYSDPNMVLLNILDF